MATVVDTVSSHLEVVSKTLESARDQSSQLFGMIKGKANVQKVSRYFYRQPLEYYAGGTFAKYGADGSSMGTGSSAKMSHLQAAYFYSRYAVTLTKEQMDTSKSDSQAIVNILSHQLAGAMGEVNAINDIIFHTNGNGKLTGVASAGTDNTTSASSLTFAGTTDYLGVNRLREGMNVDLWNTTTRVTPASSKPWITLTGIDYDTKAVTTDVGSSGGGALTTTTYATLAWIDSSTSYGPASPVTQQSTYPGVPTQTGGIGGDSFVHGFPYMTDYTSSNYFYGVQKSAFPKLNPPSVNASSAPFEWDHMHRFISKIMQRTDDDQWKKMIGICHMTQRAAIANLGVAVTTNFETGDGVGAIKDRLPTNLGYTQTFNVAGVPIYVSKRADRAQIDFINPDKIAIVEAEPIGFYQVGGKTYFEDRNSSGYVTSSMTFFISQAFDLLCTNPTQGFGRIYGLSLPSGWDA